MRFNAFTLVPTLGLGVALLLGCSGGGGGSSTSPSVNYTGLTTQAAITDTTTARTLTDGAINGGDAASIAVGVSASAQPQVTRALPSLAEVLTGLAGIAKPAVPLVAGAGFSDSINGQCGGTASLTETDNSVPGHFDVLGTMTFSGYCSPTNDGSSVVLNGAVNFSMAGTSSSNFVFTMNSSYLSATVDGQACLYSLNYSCTFSGGVSGMVTLTATYQAPDGKIYRIENYQVNVNTIAHTLTIQGRFFHPDYGYVDVTTPVGLVYTFCNSRYLPTSGTLRVTGSNGYGEFQAVDCATYRVCIDNGLTCALYSW